ncbi:hypothetical protein OROHE_018449 [Orobanche hederae]
MDRGVVRFLVTPSRGRSIPIQPNATHHLSDTSCASSIRVLDEQPSEDKI